MRDWGSELRWGAGRLRDLLRFDGELLRADELSPADRLRFGWARYRAMAQPSGALPFLGHTFHYDNRLMPAMLPGYLREVRGLDRVVGLAQATVVDIGANIGQLGATISWRFPGARVWSFEPNSTIYPLLARNAAQSSGWRTADWGLSDHDEEADLWFVPGKSAQASVIAENAVSGLRTDDVARERVDLRRLTPERMTELGLPSVVDLVKIDVEGAERSALGGLAALQWRYLAIETSLARAAGLTVDEAVELVQSVWGRRPTVVWQDEPTPGAAVLDAILALPQPG